MTNLEYCGGSTGGIFSVGLGLLEEDCMNIDGNVKGIGRIVEWWSASK